MGVTALILSFQTAPQANGGRLRLAVANQPGEGVAASNAVTSGGGYRVVSIVPQVEADHSIAEVTLSHGDAFKTVTEHCD